MSVTIKDVAKYANVSISTVSRVLSNQMHVSPATYARIQKAVEVLHYTPNASAVNLAKKSSMTVLYADSFYKGLAYENPHMFDIISGATHELRKKGYSLCLFELDKSGRNVEELLQNAVTSRTADGMIINSYYVTPRLEKLILEHDFPHICIGSPTFDSLLSWVDTNHALSSALAVDHLLNCGCKKTAFIGGLRNDNIFSSRLHGYKIALKRNGITVPDDYVICSPPIMEEIVAAVEKLLAHKDRPDSILCFNGLVAVGTVQAIKTMGLRIPEDICVVSFDNYPYAPLITPPLTVVDIDMFSLGTRTGSSLLKKMKDPELLIQSYTTLPHLIQRSSTRCNEK